MFPPLRAQSDFLSQETEESAASARVPEPLARRWWRWGRWAGALTLSSSALRAVSPAFHVHWKASIPRHLPEAEGLEMQPQAAPPRHNPRVGRGTCRNGLGGLPQWLSGEEPTCHVGDAGDVRSISGSGDALQEEMATCSSILAWEAPWPEEPGGRQSVGLQTVRHG